MHTTHPDQALAWHHQRSAELRRRACWSRQTAVRRDRVRAARLAARAARLAARAERFAARAERRSPVTARPV